MTITTKHDWKTTDKPKNYVQLSFEYVLDNEEFELVKNGLKPVEMEDKWFIYFEDDWLYIHRSWTGYLIYWLKFDDNNSVIESYVSRQAEEYNNDDLEYDKELCQFLIEAFLLNRSTKFPIRQGDSDSYPRGIYQHHIAGTGATERIVNSEEDESKPRMHGCTAAALVYIIFVIAITILGLLVRIVWLGF